MQNKFSTYQWFRKLSKSFPQWKNWLNSELAEIKKYINQSDEILIVGTGWGRETIAVAPICKTVVGIDVDEIEINTAKKKTGHYDNIKLYTENAKQMHFIDNSFDVVLCLGNTFGVLGNDKSMALNEMIRTTKLGGSIFIGVYAKTCNQLRFNAYKKIGYQVQLLTDGTIVLNGTYYSESYDEIKINQVFSNLNFTYLNINKLGYLIQIKK